MQLARCIGEPVVVSRDIGIIFTGCPIGVGLVRVANVGLMATVSRRDGKAVEGVGVPVREKLRGNGHLGNTDS